jgi:hypothetical protein
LARRQVLPRRKEEDQDQEEEEEGKHLNHI